jgi:hypothetical protein
MTEWRERLARRAVRELIDTVFMGFLALSEENRERLAAKIAAHYDRRPGWKMERKP